MSLQLLLGVILPLGLAVALVVYLVRSGRPAPPPTEAELAQSLAERRERLNAPQFEALSSHFSRALPTAYTEFFGNTSALPTGHFFLVAPTNPEHPWYVGGFCPADLQSLKDAAWVLSGPSHLPIAEADGDVFYLALESASNDDGPVYLSHHDGGDQEFLCGSLRLFLSWPRLSQAPAA